MKRALAIVIMLAAAAAVLAGAWLLWGRQDGSVKPPVDVKPQPPAVKAYAPSSYLLTEKDPPTQADPELTKRLIDTQKAENVQDIIAILLDIKKDATTRNEAANLLRRSESISLTDNLIKSLGSPEEGPLWRSYCVQHLYMNHEKAMPDEKEKIAGVLRGSLADRHTRVRREALLALCRLKDPLGKETVIQWLTAKDGEGARDVAIRCAEDLDLRDQTPAVRKLAGDSDESTAVQAIGTLGRWGDQASRPTFEEAAKAKNQRVQNAAKAALKRLDGAKNAVAPAPSSLPH